MNEEIRVLRVTQLKGRPVADDIIAATALVPEAAQDLLDQLTEAGYVAETNGRYKLTQDGKARLEGLLADERAGIDGDAILTAYHEFDGFNAEFKQLVTDWQLVDGTTPNDHSDSEYDAKIVSRLADLHERFLPFMTRLVAVAPRLAAYPDRFSRALSKVQGGDHSWLAKPLADSYHTVWFELHEDLIGLANLSRVDEAAAGRAE